MAETKVLLVLLAVAACLFCYALGESIGIDKGINRVRASACVGYCDEFWRDQAQGDYLGCLERCEVWDCDDAR